MPKDDDDCGPSKKKDTCDPCKKSDPCEKPPDPCKKESVCKSEESHMEKKIETARQKCKKIGPPPPRQRKVDDKFQEQMRLLKKPAVQKPKAPSAASQQISNASQQISKLISNFTANLTKENLICAIKCSKDWIVQNCDPRKQKMADKGAATPGRPMKYPYTFSAKFAQFPLKYYINNQWIWKYYFASVAICIPLFYSINKLANSPGNVAKWAEIRRKEAAEHH